MKLHFFLCWYCISALFCPPYSNRQRQLAGSSSWCADFCMHFGFATLNFEVKLVCEQKLAWFSTALWPCLNFSGKTVELWKSPESWESWKHRQKCSFWVIHTFYKSQKLSVHINYWSVHLLKKIKVEIACNKKKCTDADFYIHYILLYLGAYIYLSKGDLAQI